MNYSNVSRRYLRLFASRAIRLLMLPLLTLPLLGAGCDPHLLAADAGSDQFLDSSDFQGNYRTRRPPNGPWAGGQSIWDGRLVFVNLPREVVDDVLPADLHLAINTNASFPDVHPVALLYGHQANTQWVLPWGAPPGARLSRIDSADSVRPAHQRTALA